MSKVLIFIIFLNIASVLVIDFFPENWQWYIWDLTNLLVIIILSSLLFRKISYLRTLPKILALLCIIIHIWLAFDYIAISLVENILLRTSVRQVLAGVFIIIYLPLIAHIVLRKYSLRSDVYRPNSCYLAYKRPVNLTGLIAAFASMPYGHCTFVHGERQFLFKRGVLVERNFVRTDKYYLRRTIDFPIQNLRKLIGLKWSIKNNCFNIFYNLVKYNDKTI
jgi:hypothetical protein